MEMQKFCFSIGERLWRALFPSFWGGARLRRAPFPFFPGARALFFPFPFIFFWGAPSACMLLVALFFLLRRACDVHIERLPLHFSGWCAVLWDLGSGKADSKLAQKKSLP